MSILYLGYTCGPQTTWMDDLSKIFLRNSLWQVKDQTWPKEINALTYLSYRASHVVGKGVNEHKILNSLFKEVMRHVEDKKGKDIKLMENFHRFGAIF